MNSVTGEPIAHALVRVFGVAQRAVFTDSEGRFEIGDLPAGMTSFQLQKPGYFSRQQLRSSSGNDVVEVGPNTTSVLLKLFPQSAIYGRITDTDGQPVEQIPVRLSQRSMRDGRLRWGTIGYAQSGEDGRFRLAGLLPGTYYLEVGPGNPESRLLARHESPKKGYPVTYYAGVSDLAAASPIQLTVGQQAQVDVPMTAVPVYHISGTLTSAGYLPENGIGIHVLNPSGEQISITARVHLDTGTFDIDAAPAGSYVLKATSQAGSQPLRAEVYLAVAANLDNVHLVLGPALSIPVTVRMEAHNPSNLSQPGWNQQRPPVAVRMIPAQPLAPDLSSTIVQQGPGREFMAVQDVEPGKYMADVSAWGPWYVQSAMYGPTNLLSDDLVVAAGQTFSIEIVLRDDGATLTGNLNSSEAHGLNTTAIIVSQPASRRSAKVVQFSPQYGFTMNGLAPGDYLVFAFDHADKIEYSNPEALQPYVSQASRVTLSPNQESHVTLKLIHTGEED